MVGHFLNLVDLLTLQDCHYGRFWGKEHVITKDAVTTEGVDHFARKGMISYSAEMTSLRYWRHDKDHTMSVCPVIIQRLCSEISWAWPARSCSHTLVPYIFVQACIITLYRGLHAISGAAAFASQMAFHSSLARQSIIDVLATHEQDNTHYASCKILQFNYTPALWSIAPSTIFLCILAL